MKSLCLIRRFIDTVHAFDYDSVLAGYCVRRLPTTSTLLTQFLVTNIYCVALHIDERMAA